MSEEVKELHQVIRKLLQFVEEKKLILTLAGAACLLALVVVGLARHISRTREEEASAKLAAALRLPGGGGLSELENLSYRIKGTAAHPWALLKLGQEYFRKQDLQPAERAFEQAAAADNQYVAGLAYIGLACVYEEQKDFNRARLALDRAVGASEGSPMIVGEAKYRRDILDALEEQARASSEPELQSESDQQPESNQEKD